MDIREIEKIIDDAHKNHPFFASSKRCAIIKLLATFEDMCSLSMAASILNPVAFAQIREYMDALNMALKWVESCCTDTLEEHVAFSEDDYASASNLMLDYSLPYSVICSGYIAYNRKRMIADVRENVVEFNLREDQNKSAWADIVRETENHSFGEIMNISSQVGLMYSSEQLKKNTFIENDQLCYSLTDGIIDTFKKIATAQWELTKTLPTSWKFDEFTLAEYREVWITVTTLCNIHLVACTTLGDVNLRLTQSLIMKSKDEIIGILNTVSGIDPQTIQRILNYITFEPKRQNGDIMYQPIIQFEDTVVITPFLFMGSRPERNLLALINAKHDHEHSKQVNDLERLMVSELDEVIQESDQILVRRHKVIPVSDIDYIVLDKSTNTALLCEIKWFSAADSSQEVYAREDEINHGCKQIETIMAYAMKDKSEFFKRVFNIENGEEIDLFCCVIAKHNIRTQNKYVPVIDLKRIKELFSNYPVNSVFHKIRNHEYELEMPKSGEITHKIVEYAGYKFMIPAIAFGEEILDI